MGRRVQFDRDSLKIECRQYVQQCLKYDLHDKKIMKYMKKNMKEISINLQFLLLLLAGLDIRFGRMYVMHVYYCPQVQWFPFYIIL